MCPRSGSGRKQPECEKFCTLKELFCAGIKRASDGNSVNSPRVLCRPGTVSQSIITRRWDGGFFFFRRGVVYSDEGKWSCVFFRCFDDCIFKIF